MIDCRRTAELLSAEQDRPLTWRERFQLSFHLGLCEMCRAYARQLQRIKALLRLSRETDAEASLPDAELTDEARARISAAMERENAS